MEGLNKIVSEIADYHGRMDGLIAAAGIQQETPALEYTAEDCDRMMSVNVTGCFMTAQAVAKQMIRFGNGGSVVMIASMSGTVANRVSCSSFFIRLLRKLGLTTNKGTHLPRLQRLQSRRLATGTQPRLRMGPIRHSCQYHLSWLHRHCYG